MKQAKIDMIVLGGYHTAAALMIKQSREQGLGAQMVGFDSLETAEFAQLGGAATNGVLMSFPPKAEDDPKNADLVKKFRDAKYNPEGYTLFSYAAVKVWAQAAAKAKSTDPAAGDAADYNRSPGDRMHRSHRFIASNQLMPKMLELEGWQEQVEAGFQRI